MSEMNNKFEYELSIVIPAYNSSKWLRLCLESIFTSCVQKEIIQVILVDDGSDDNVYDICLDCLRENHDSNIIIRKICHAGVSAARNEGIKAAEGKFIMFVDSDDMLHENTLNYIIRFFNMHYNETDVLLCHYVYTNDDGTAAIDSGFFKKILPNSGIYSLKNTMVYSDYALPIVKNRGNDTPLFSKELYWREDMEYLYRAASEKGTIGYIKESQYYKLNRSRSWKTPLRVDKELSEQLLKTAEAIFAGISDDSTVKYAASADIMNMFNSHMKDDSFWPHQLKDLEYKRFEQRVTSILSHIDTEVILNHPAMDLYNKSYWLKYKPNADITIRLESGFEELSADGMLLEHRRNVEWTLRRIRSFGSKITIFGDFKLAAFDFLSYENKEVVFIACKNGKVNETLHAKPSAFGFTANSRMFTNNMWAFQITIDTKVVSSLELFVIIRGLKYKTAIVNCANTVFNKTNKLKTAPVGHVLVTQTAGRMLEFQMLNDEQLIQYRDKISTKFLFDNFAYDIRKKCNYFFNRRIWVYNDNFTMVDNGYFQFSHDVRIDDGIERYYVVKNRESKAIKNADELVKSHLVEYGSEEHILYILNAEKVFTAFFSGLEWRPIQFNEMYKYWDIFNAEIIMLSHGVMNQFWAWNHTPLRFIDKIVISTFAEYRAWCENGFWQKDLLPFGMPRYSEMLKTANPKPKRKILLALSWRQYLVGKHEILLDAATSRIPLDDKYLKSSYFKNFMEFINSDTLGKLLTDNELELDVNLHPQFNLLYRDHMDIKNSRVNITDGHAELSDYLMMITDISSIMFDFAVYKRPIMYFIPDITEFKMGRNHFREVIIPFEDGLGPCTYSPEAAVEELGKLISNGFMMEEKYRLRLEHHHIPLDDCCGKIYRYCIEENTELKITGSTPETINPFMDKVIALQNGRQIPLLKSIYDIVSIPYNKMLKSGINREETDLRKYFNKIKSDSRYVICFAVSDTASRYWREFINRSGLALKRRPGWRYSYLALIESGRVIYENSERGALFYNYTVKQTNAKISIFSRHFDQYEYPKTYAIVAVNGYNYSMNRRGINVVVYDKNTDSVCDSFAIDLYADETTAMLRI